MFDIAEFWVSDFVSISWFLYLLKRGSKIFLKKKNFAENYYLLYRGILIIFILTMEKRSIFVTNVKQVTFLSQLCIITSGKIIMVIRHTFAIFVEKHTITKLATENICLQLMDKASITQLQFWCTLKKFPLRGYYPGPPEGPGNWKAKRIIPKIFFTNETYATTLVTVVVCISEWTNAALWSKWPIFGLA